jgi:hypothetical protein
MRFAASRTPSPETQTRRRMSAGLRGFEKSSLDPSAAWRAAPVRAAPRDGPNAGSRGRAACSSRRDRGGKARTRGRESAGPRGIEKSRLGSPTQPGGAARVRAAARARPNAAPRRIGELRPGPCALPRKTRTRRREVDGSGGIEKSLWIPSTASAAAPLRARTAAGPNAGFRAASGEGRKTISPPSTTWRADGIEKSLSPAQFCDCGMPSRSRDGADRGFWNFSRNLRTTVGRAGRPRELDASLPRSERVDARPAGSTPVSGRCRRPAGWAGQLPKSAVRCCLRIASFRAQMISPVSMFTQLNTNW